MMNVRGVGVAAVTAGVVLLAIAGTHALPGAAVADPRVPEGQKLFMQYCAMCHGDGGAGDGEMSRSLQRRAGVRPANLDDRARMQKLGRAGVRRVIEQGGAHTGRSNLMPAWGNRLTHRQIDQISDWVVDLPDSPVSTSAEVAREFMAAPPGSAADGRRLFVHHCAACHGTGGRGDGPFAQSLLLKHKIRPRNLTDATYMSRKTDAQLFETVMLGGAHMGKSPYMPVWAGYLTPGEVRSIVSYVRTLSTTAAKRPAAGGPAKRRS